MSKSNQTEQNRGKSSVVNKFDQLDLVGYFRVSYLFIP